jgi:hypothetical protein
MAQVSHRKFYHQLRLMLGYSLFIIPYDKYVINIHDQNNL